MSKRAEERALKVYPKIPGYLGRRFDVYRGLIVLGYEQAGNVYRSLDGVKS